jgi:hypothetical protein
MGKLVASDFDADGDGRFDISYEYDYFQEISRKWRTAHEPAP